MPSDECLNLKQLYGDKYRVKYHRELPDSLERDPWLLRLACRFGFIEPWGGETLAIYLPGHPVIARKLVALGCVPHQWGQTEYRLVFPAKRFWRIAKLVKPKQKRRLSDETHARLVTQLVDARKRLPSSPSDRNRD